MSLAMDLHRIYYSTVMEASPPLSSRPTSGGRNVPLTLTERVMLYCHQTTAAHNAGVLRNVSKPTANEITEFLHHSRTQGDNLYDNTALVRVLLTDSDYDAICREVLNLQDAIAWHTNQAHVFTIDEIRAALVLAMSLGVDEEVLRMFPESIRHATGVQPPGSKTQHLRQTEKVTMNEEPLDKGKTLETQAVAIAHDNTTSLREPNVITYRVNETVKEQFTEQQDDGTVHDADAPSIDCTNSLQRDVSSNVVMTPFEASVVTESITTSEVQRLKNEDDTAEPPSDPTVHPNGAVEWVKDTVETTVVSTMVQHVLSSHHSNSEDEEKEDTENQVETMPQLENAEPVVSTERLSSINVIVHIPDADLVDQEETEKMVIEAETSPCLHNAEPMESVSGIETIVRTLDADLVDHEASDSEDLAFAEDASLLRQLSVTPIARDAPSIVHDTSIDVHLNAATRSLQNETTPSTVAPPVLFQVGHAVRARYRGRIHFFPGIITAVHTADGTYDIQYTDGDTEMNVHGDLIRLANDDPATSISDTVNVPSSPPTDPTQLTDLYRVGDAVEAQYLGLNRYFPGEIADVLGNGRYNVRYTDGEYESDVRFELIRPPTERVHLSENNVNGTTSEGTNQGTVRDTVETVELISSDVEASAKAVTVIDGVDEPLVHIITTEHTVMCEDKAIDRGVECRRGDSHHFSVESEQTERHELECGSRQRIEGDNKRRPSSRLRDTRDERASVTTNSDVQGNQTPDEMVMDIETTPVLPFNEVKHQSKQPPQLTDKNDFPTITAARALLSDDDSSDEDRRINERVDVSDEDANDDDVLAVDRILHVTAQLQDTVNVKEPVVEATTTTRKASAKKKTPLPVRESSDVQSCVPALSASTLRYLSPHPRTRMSARTPRPKPNAQQTTTPRTGTATHRSRQPERDKSDVSWRELEEWKNVDLILNRKRRVVLNGHVGGSDVPWGEEFAAIQSLKRFAAQYPTVLRDYIKCKLADVTASDGTGRPTTAKMTSAARDALFLIKDLAFLLRHRLAPFLDVILPVLLPAVFHSHKRFLCDAAYEILEALIAHCSSRKLVVALLKQAQRFPCDDLRLVNLTCLYVEKCLAVLSTTTIEELLSRNGLAVLSSIAELLMCKSAACQSSLQKSLRILQYAVGEVTMERLLVDCLGGNELALVRRHFALAESAGRGASNSHSPSASPKKQIQQPPHVDMTKTMGASGGGVSILQRMLAQRQNRVLPAPE